MKFEKNSFLAFLQSLKQGSVLIVAAIKKSTEAQDAANEKIIAVATTAQERLDEIAEKKIDLHALESIDQNIEATKETLKKIQAAVEEKPSGEITLANPVKIEKPSWLSELKTPLSPILEGFAGLIGSISPIKTILEKIEKREIKLPLTKDGRIMVEVDRVGSGGGSRSTPVNEAILKRGLYLPTFDYASQAQAATTDTWVFKTGGAGGTTVATVVITYTDATKAVISNVAQS